MSALRRPVGQRIWYGGETLVIAALPTGEVLTRRARELVLAPWSTALDAAQLWRVRMLPDGWMALVEGVEDTCARDAPSTVCLEGGAVDAPPGTGVGIGTVSGEDPQQFHIGDNWDGSWTFRAPATGYVLTANEDRRIVTLELDYRLPAQRWLVDAVEAP